MRKLQFPPVNDAAILKDLTLSRSDNAQAIRKLIPAIEARFSEYHHGEGNPWVVHLDDRFKESRAHFHHLYSTPPLALDYIDKLRNSLPGACPVCGGSRPGTLDHYLPKSLYAEYSFYSRNLVPACHGCNVQRGVLTKGLTADERPVHPYYDEFARRRIMTIEIIPPWEAPTIKVLPFGLMGAELKTVKWHIENIILPAGLNANIDDLWGAIVANPSDFFPDRTSTASMSREARRWQTVQEANDRSKNGWWSSFFHGLSKNSAALKYIASLTNTTHDEGLDWY